ncbi:MAG: sodium:proton exchanger [Chitinophagaceae bacterium]|nr:MAG: sodium:proton exchanger [Chitinophagaceae bacterium]
MGNLSVEMLLLILSSVVVISYLFSILSRYIKIPSVLLLLASGIVLRVIVDQQQLQISFPPILVEFLGVTGLVMIVLEAGLDLRLTADKKKLIRDSFFSALVIFLVSLGGIAAGLHYWLEETWLKCIVYAIPLSIMSSSIVIPSLHALSPQKKEFLVYEASFSDIIGILVFNFLVAGETFSLISVGSFFLNIVVSIVLSLLFSFLLLIILAKSQLNIKFFLIFALLIFLYVSGKLLHLPSLIIILVFGLLMNNWRLVSIKKIQQYFPQQQVEGITHLLHSITAESSFLIRTFFFVLFGFSIDLKLIMNNDVIFVGSIIVLTLLIVRFLYLRFFLKEQVFPEVVFIPRGLITILLFYKIPQFLKLESFNEGILFFVILLSSLIMMFGMFFYKHKPGEIVEDHMNANNLP